MRFFPPPVLPLWLDIISEREQSLPIPFLLLLMPFPGKAADAKEVAGVRGWHLRSQLSTNLAPVFQEDFYTATVRAPADIKTVSHWPGVQVTESSTTRRISSFCSPASPRTM